MNFVVKNTSSALSVWIKGRVGEREKKRKKEKKKKKEKRKRKKDQRK